MLNAKRIVFVNEYIKDTDHIRAYEVAFKSNSKQVARVSGLKLLKVKEIANLISEKLAIKNKIIDDARAVEIEEATKNGILSDLELEIKLCEIVKGELEIEKILIIGGRPTKARVKPDISDITNAINILFKKRGSNAPIKSDVTSGGETIRQVFKIGDKEFEF